MNIDEFFIKEYLERFDKVPFEVNYKNKEIFKIGEGDTKFKVRINGDIKKTDILNSTSLALGEAYIKGTIDIEGDLYTVLDILLSQINKFSKNDKGVIKKILHTSTSIKHQKEEVTTHYDIGNDFYSLWLDKTMSYSCAYFKNQDDTLYEAQMNKIHHILNKLNLSEGMTLLDIGCGWGYLLIEAAKKYKVHGVGITLSEEQYSKFSNRIKEEGLEEYLDVKLMDYRNLDKLDLKFDRVVSVGMLEHVGRENYKLFFQNIDEVLKEKGIFLLHYISSLEESDGDPFIKKYIFPGGCIPSLREIVSISADFKYNIIDIESLRLHYKKTLLCWEKNFEENLDKERKMFDEEFIRMWRMYLVSCAAAFDNAVVDLHQILMTKGVNNSLPLTRDYIYQ